MAGSDSKIGVWTETTVEGQPYWHSAGIDDRLPGAEAPAAPTGLAVTPGSTTASLTWNAVTGADSIALYRRDDTAMGSFALVTAAIAGNATSYNDTGLTPENEYSWYITATNEAGTSDPSSTVTDTTTAAPAATRHIYIDFEGGSSISPLTTWGTDSVLVVDDNPYEGTYSLRGNLASGLSGNDPLTGKPRNNSPLNLDIAGLTSDANRTWDKVYVRYRMRFDDADNRQDTNAVSTPKLAYFSDTSLTFETGCAIWPVLEPVFGLRSIYKNSNGDSFDPFPDYPGTAPTGACTGCGFGYDGAWTKVEALFDHVNHTHEYWINDVKFLGTSSATDGVWPMAEAFRLDHIRFFHGNNNVWANSTNGDGEKGGVQLDAIEIWEGDPRV